MRRRWDVIRYIVFEVHDLEAVRMLSQLCPDDCSESEWREHIRLAQEGGLIAWAGGSRFALTPLGLDFFDAAQNDSIWFEATDLIERKLSGGAPLELLFWVLMEVAKRRVRQTMQEPWR